MKLINTLGALAFVAVTAACGNTADGVKKDTENAAEATAEKTADASAATAGAMETGQVKTAIMADTRVDAGDINVDTDEDKKTVTLNGSVKTEAERTIAGDIATSKAVGYSVVNNLTVKP